MAEVSAVFVGIDAAKMKHAVAVAEPGRNGEVRYFGEINASPEAVRKLLDRLAAKHLAAASQIASAAGLICETLHVMHEQPYQAIIEVAAEKNCDLIVMASHGRRGIAAVVLGSETVKVLTHSTIPVLVFRARHYDQLTVAS